MKRTYESILNYITLFLPIDFLTDDRLVRKLLVSLLVNLVKKNKISLAELSLITSLLIDFVDLSYAYILSVFTVELTKNLPLKKWTAQIHLLVHWDDKTS